MLGPPRDPGGLRAPPQGLARDPPGILQRLWEATWRPPGTLQGPPRTLTDPCSILHKNMTNPKHRKSTNQLQIPMKTQIRLFNVSLSTPRNTRPCAAKCENCDSDWVPFLVNFEPFFKLFRCRSPNGLFLYFVFDVFERKSFEICWFDLAFSLQFPMKSAFSIVAASVAI